MSVGCLAQKQELEAQQVGVVLDVLIGDLLAVLAFFELELGGVEQQLDGVSAVDTSFLHNF